MGRWRRRRETRREKGRRGVEELAALRDGSRRARVIDLMEVSESYLVAKVFVGNAAWRLDAGRWQDYFTVSIIIQPVYISAQNITKQWYQKGNNAAREYNITNTNSISHPQKQSPLPIISAAA